MARKPSGVGRGRGPRSPQQNRIRIPVEEIQKNIKVLQKYPYLLNYEQIAASAGVSARTVHNIMTNKRKFINPGTAEALMRVTPIRKDNPEDLLPVEGTSRRLKALAVAGGWSWSEVSAITGISEHSLQRLRNSNRHTLVRRATADKVKKAYDELWNKQNPNEARRERVKDAARKQGWHPPFAWDDDEIDDPRAKPKGVTQYAERAEKAKITAEQQREQNVARIRELMGWDTDTCWEFMGILPFSKIPDEEDALKVLEWLVESSGKQSGNQIKQPG